MPLEKEHQDECYRTLLTFGGLTHKLVQDTVLCDHCHRPVHPKNKGWADYHSELMIKNSHPWPVKVECKGDRDRFEVSNLRVEQREWLSNYKSQAYFWLQLGTARVDSSNYMARKVWMIPWPEYLHLEQTVLEQTNVKYIPINLAAAIAANMRFKDYNLTAFSLFCKFEMEWLGTPLNKWRPNRYHPIWNLNTEVTYESFNLQQ